MRMTKTLWPLCVAAVALGLNGCGGGSTTQPEPTPTMPPAKETPMVEAPAAPETPAPTAMSLGLDGKALLAALNPTDETPPATATPHEAFAMIAGGGKVSQGTAQAITDDALFGTKYEKSSILAPEVEGEGWMSSVYMREKQTAGDGTPGATDDVTTSDMVTAYTNMKDSDYRGAFLRYVLRCDATGDPFQSHVQDVSDGVLDMVDSAQGAVAVHSFVIGGWTTVSEKSNLLRGTPPTGTKARTTCQRQQRVWSGMFNGIAGTYWCANAGFCSADQRIPKEMSNSTRGRLEVHTRRNRGPAEDPGSHGRGSRPRFPDLRLLAADHHGQGWPHVHGRYVRHGQGAGDVAYQVGTTRPMSGVRRITRDRRLVCSSSGKRPRWAMETRSLRDASPPKPR